MAVEHVLVDADGVLQRSPHDPYAVLARWAGERAPALAHELWAAEKPVLRGEEDFLEVVARVLPRHLRPGARADPCEVYAALWLEIAVAPATLALVARLRALGVGVHLAANQHRQRAQHMRTALGYDEAFDLSCYSWELGAAKPEPDYFRRVLEQVRARPEQVLLIDDNADNVDGARGQGLRAVHWHLDEGHDVLREALAGHGLAVGAA